MDLSRRMKRILLCLLVGIHLLFRYPTTPRAIGSTDSFYVIGMTFSIRRLNGMPWVPTAPAYAGLYPFAYPSGAAASLASVWEITGMGPDGSLFCFALAFSLVGLFGSFMLGRTIKHDFITGYATAFAFSVAPILLRYSFWMISARSLFVCLLPIFVWFLFKTLSERHGSRYALGAAFLFPVMLFVHHIGLFLPVLFIGYLLAHLTYRGMEKMKLVSIYSKDVVRSLSVIVLAFFVFLLILQTLMDSVYSPDLEMFKTWYLRDEGNPLVTLLNIGIFYMISAGVLMLCGVFGFARLLERTDKNGPQWGILFVLLMFAYFIADQLYLVVFLMPLLMPVIGYGVHTIVTRTESSPGMSLLILGAVLLTALPHGTYAMDDWLENRNDEYGYRRWAYEETVATSIYLGQETNEVYICNDGHWTRRLTAYSGIEGMPLEPNEFATLDDDYEDRIESEKVALWDFYTDKDMRKDEKIWQFEWKDTNDSYAIKYSNIVRYPVDDPRVVENLSVFDVSVAVVNQYFPDQSGKATQYYALKFSPFFASLPDARFVLHATEYELVYQL